MLNGFDFEVTKYDWLVVIKNPVNKTCVKIHNDRKKLEEYYEKHAQELWVSYNGRNYDQWIFKGILVGLDPYAISTFIIEEGRKGFEYSDLLTGIPFYNYDAMTVMRSLKQCEAFMGHDIQETSTPFTIQRKLTRREVEEMFVYCEHDVDEMFEVMAICKDDFNAHLDLLKTFNLPFSNISKTKSQLSAIALGCKRVPHDDEWDISFVPTIKLNKYAFVKEWYSHPENYNQEQKLDIMIDGVPHSFGLGGLHGAPERPVHIKGLLLHVDVTSFYPSMMIEYDLLSRNVRDKKIFKQIYDKRVALKKAGKKAEQAPYKIILNATFGITNDKYSTAYDARRNHEVCINGQLLLLDLLEKLEGNCKIVQSNTDGIIIWIEDTDEAFNKIDDICYEWETRTRMGLSFDIIDEIWQGDVNNYIFHFKGTDKYERKGAYVKELSPIDNDLPIVNKAIVDRITKGIPVEVTINNCDELIMFQKVVKVSSKYNCAWHNGKNLNEKTFRVFASKNQNDTFIGKRKLVDEKNNPNGDWSGGVKTGRKVLNMEKFANTPEHCFIDNSYIVGKKIPLNLDKQWYIMLSTQRLLEKFNIQN